MDAGGMAGYPWCTSIECPEGATFEDSGVNLHGHIRFYLYAGNMTVNKYTIDIIGGAYWVDAGAHAEVQSLWHDITLLDLTVCMGVKSLLSSPCGFSLSMVYIQQVSVSGSVYILGSVYALAKIPESVFTSSRLVRMLHYACILCLMFTLITPA